MMNISKKLNSNRIPIPSSVFVVSVFVIAAILLVGALFVKYNSNNYHNYYDTSSIFLFVTNAYAQYDEGGGGGYDSGGYDSGGYDSGGYDSGGYDSGAPDYGPSEPPDYGTPDNTPDYNVPEPPEPAPAPEPEPPAPAESPPSAAVESPPLNTVETPPSSSQPTTPSETQAPLLQTPPPLVEAPSPNQIEAQPSEPSTNPVEANPNNNNNNNNPATTVGPDTTIPNPMGTTPTDSAKQPDTATAPASSSGANDDSNLPLAGSMDITVDNSCASSPQGCPSENDIPVHDDKGNIINNDNKAPDSILSDKDLAFIVSGSQPSDNNKGDSDPLKQYLSPAESNPNALNPNTIAGGGMCGQDVDCTTAAQDMNLLKEAADNNPFPNSSECNELTNCPTGNRDLDRQFEGMKFLDTTLREDLLHPSQLFDDLNRVCQSDPNFCGAVFTYVGVTGGGVEPFPATELPLVNEVPTVGETPQTGIPEKPPSGIDSTPVVDESPSTNDGTTKPSGETEIQNPVLDQPRIGDGSIKGGGSGNKVDPEYAIFDDKGNIIKEFPATAKGHGWPDIVDNYAGYATQFELRPGVTLYQLEGDYNGVPGRFEWIVDNNMGGVTHREFVPYGTINGIPTKR